MKKYWRIYKAIIANSLSYESQYRADTWLRMGFNFLWILTLFLTVEVIFSSTTSIAGWSKSDLYLLTSFWMIIDEICMMLFDANLPRLPDAITQGDLDIYLTKPINTLFVVSTKIFLIRGFYRLIMEVVVLIWVLIKFNFSFEISYLLMGIALGLVSIIVNYSMALFFNTFSFWFHRIDNINDMLNTIKAAGRFPIDVLPRTAKIVVLTLIPVAFSAYIPVATIIGRWPWLGIIYAWAFGALLFFLVVKFWNFALTKYSSASS